MNSSSSSSSRLFRAPAAFVSAAGFQKRHKGKAIFSGRRLLAEWCRRSSVFLLLVLFCLLVAPPLWFVSRAVAPTPAFIADLDGGRQKLPRASWQHHQTVTTEDLPPIDDIPRPPEPERAKLFDSGVVDVEAPSPRVPQDELAQASSDEREQENDVGHPERASETPAAAVLPAEVFRDVPPEECLQSPLWRKRVDPSDYEFGCDEIYVSPSCGAHFSDALSTKYYLHAF